MARKGKIGIDYFSHDVDMMQDKKIKLLKAKHGLIGYAVYLRLLEELYREGGYFLTIDEDFNILFSDDNNLDYNVYILILNDCINNELFDKKSYNTHSIITSERIQLNYLSATERRKSVEFIKEYLLVSPLKFYNLEKVNVDIISLNVDINGENDDIGTQRKGKRKERENEIKELWSMYPLKKGKADYLKKIDKVLDEYGFDKISKAIRVYDKSVVGDKREYLYHGSTFFNGKYIDYLDENYEETKTPDKPNEDWRKVQWSNE